VLKKWCWSIQGLNTKLLPKESKQQYACAGWGENENCTKLPINTHTWFCAFIHAEMCNTSELCTQTSSYLTWCWRQTVWGMSLRHTQLTVYPFVMGRSISHSPLIGLATADHTQLPDGQIKHWGLSVLPVWPEQAAQVPHLK
jgi:hypothetical protein